MQQQFLKLLKLFGIGMGSAIGLGLAIYGIDKLMDHLKEENNEQIDTKRREM